MASEGGLYPRRSIGNRALARSRLDETGRDGAETDQFQCRARLIRGRRARGRLEPGPAHPPAQTDGLARSRQAAASSRMSSRLPAVSGLRPSVVDPVLELRVRSEDVVDVGLVEIL